MCCWFVLVGSSWLAYDAANPMLIGFASPNMALNPRLRRRSGRETMASIGGIGNLVIASSHVAVPLVFTGLVVAADPPSG